MYNYRLRREQHTERDLVNKEPVKGTVDNMMASILEAFMSDEGTQESDTNSTTIDVVGE